MDPNTALALILDLYAQLSVAQRRIAELTEQLVEASDDTA